eukprot:GHVU01063341.1.p5 GENE.GHVU01063341.1~~GHVU01063341.1.p5  ORF type:complete len:110 (-),score=13.81 GHVU01063341.1:1829-2158(-)
MIRHYGIPVKDLDISIKFYAKFYFMPYAYENTMIAGKAVAICKLVNKDGQMIELVQGKTAVPHISIAVTKMLFEYLKEEYNAEMFEKEGVCYIKDADNNILEIVEERGF